MMGRNRLTKVTLVNFLPKRCLRAICPKIIPSCIVLPTLMIIFKHCSNVMRYLKQTKITVNFSKKSPLGVNGDLCSLWPKTSTPYISCYASILWRHCSIMEHNRWTMVVIVNSPPKNLFSSKRRIWAQFGPMFFNHISHDLSQSSF